jgi:hypothetical protein
MRMTLQIKTAAELVDPALEARWTTRRVARETEILQVSLRAFLERPDPIVVEEIIRAFPERAPDDIRAALTRLDEDDLIQIRDGRVDLAYPFSATPTSFVVYLSGRGDRYACLLRHRRVGRCSDARGVGAHPIALPSLRGDP